MIYLNYAILYMYMYLLHLTLTLEQSPDDLGVKVDGLKAWSTTDEELIVWLCLRTKKIQSWFNKNTDYTLKKTKEEAKEEEIMIQ